MSFVIAQFINRETGERTYLKFFPDRDTPATVHDLLVRMANNGWDPVKGSGRVVGRTQESKRIPMVRKPIISRQGAAFIR